MRAARGTALTRLGNWDVQAPAASTTLRSLDAAAVLNKNSAHAAVLEPEILYVLAPRESGRPAGRTRAPERGPGGCSGPARRSESGAPPRSRTDRPWGSSVRACVSVMRSAGMPRWAQPSSRRRMLSSAAGEVRSAPINSSAPQRTKPTSMPVSSSSRGAQASWSLMLSKTRS